MIETSSGNFVNQCSYSLIHGHRLLSGKGAFISSFVPIFQREREREREREIERERERKSAMAKKIVLIEIDELLT